MIAISTQKAPKAIGAYSQGTMVGHTLYVSGQLPLDPETMEMKSTDIESLTHQALSNILAVVEAAGLEKNDIVRCGIFITDMRQFSEIDGVYAKFFGDHKPARAVVEVRGLPKGAPIEIDAIAHNNQT